MALQVFWQPDGINLDQIGDKKLADPDGTGDSGIVDGDTPKIELNIRMLSIDTPEKGTVARGLGHDELKGLLPGLRAWIASGDSPVEPVLAAHLLAKLDHADPAQAHWDQGADATAAHKDITRTRLAKPGGGQRRLFVRVADERFDRYGRLLAYTAPDYDADERRNMTRRERATFNFDMIESGWAATLIIYPSIPGERDLPMVQQAAEAAVVNGLGAWADPQAMPGYEYRMVEKLALLFQKVEAGENISGSQWHGWVSRYCADISDARLYPPQEYCRVAPWNRLFIWKDDVRAAVRDLNLTPAPAAPLPV